MHSYRGESILIPLKIAERKRLSTRLMKSYTFTIRPDQVPNVRHLRVQHTFSSMTSSPS